MSRVSVDVEWEKGNRTKESVLFEIPTDYISDSISTSSAFAIALSLPALHHGEDRLRLSSPLDPAVVNNVQCVLAQHSKWFGYNHKKFTIQAETQNPPRPKNTGIRAGSFFSGGVDSFWTLKRNLVTLPIGHPLRIQDIIFVHGFDIGWKKGEIGNIALYDKTVNLFDEYSKNNNVNSINIRTNIRHIFDNSNFWAARWHGMVLASIGYLLSKKITDLFIPAANDLWHPDAWGTSPLIEPTLSSHYIHFHHDGVDNTRLDKVKYIAKWPGELKLLRICTKTDNIPDGYLNCGRCEKCLRTKLELIASNISPESASSFLDSEVDIDLLDNISPNTSYHASEYNELIEPLYRLNRPDLANASKRIVERWNKWSHWKNEQTVGGLLKQIIRKFTKTWPPIPQVDAMKIK